MDLFIVSIAISLLVILVTAFFLFKRKSTRDSILLIGPSESGKTTLFTQIAYNSFTETVTSMQENEAPIPLKDQNKSLNLIDLPGFDRLRDQYWEKFKNRAKCLIYVVDSLNFMSNQHNVADLLYQHLCDNSVIANRLPVLVACTKQDETRSKSAKVISSILEKEFNTIRETRMGALDTTAGDDKSQNILGDVSRTFKFSDLPNQIEFVDCSASRDQKNLEKVIHWINTKA